VTDGSGTSVVVVAAGVLAEATGTGSVVVLVVDVERGGAEVVGGVLAEPGTESGVEV
jgi:hypothetical protein